MPALSAPPRAGRPRGPKLAAEAETPRPSPPARPPRLYDRFLITALAGADARGPGGLGARAHRAGMLPAAPNSRRSTWDAARRAAELSANNGPLVFRWRN